MGASSMRRGARHSAGGVGASGSDDLQASREPADVALLREASLLADPPAWNSSPTAATLPPEPVAIANAPSDAFWRKWVAPSQSPWRSSRFAWLTIVVL